MEGVPWISQGSFSQRPPTLRAGWRYINLSCGEVWFVPRKTGSLCCFTACDFAASAGKKAVPSSPETPPPSLPPKPPPSPPPPSSV